MKKESKFQKDFIDEVKSLYPDSIIFKTDPRQIQGFPDLLILNGNTWAALECKREKNSSRQPNQETWVDILNKMSYSNFLDPSNKEDVIRDLQQTFGTRR